VRASPGIRSGMEKQMLRVIPKTWINAPLYEAQVAAYHTYYLLGSSRYSWEIEKLRQFNRETLEKFIFDKMKSRVTYI
jgi:hypothetical protein